MRFNSCSKCGSGAINLHRYDRDKQPPDLQQPDLCVDSKALCLCEYKDRKEAANEIERLRNMIEAHHTQWLNAQKMIEARDDEIKRLQKENKKQHEKIMFLNSYIETKHEIIRIAALKGNK